MEYWALPGSNSPWHPCTLPFLRWNELLLGDHFLELTNKVSHLYHLWDFCPQPRPKAIDKQANDLLEPPYEGELVHYYPWDSCSWPLQGGFYKLSNGLLLQQYEVLFCQNDLQDSCPQCNPLKIGRKMKYFGYIIIQIWMQYYKKWHVLYSIVWVQFSWYISKNCLYLSLEIFSEKTRICTSLNLVAIAILSLIFKNSKDRLSTSIQNQIHRLRLLTYSQLILLWFIGCCTKQLQ